MDDEGKAELERQLQYLQERAVSVQRLASLGMLIAGISHEIKNPLNFVNNFSKVSLERLNELEDYLNKSKITNEEVQSEIKETIESLKNNINKILFHGKRAENILMHVLAQAKGDVIEKQSVAIHEIIEEALKLAYHGFRGQEPSFNVNIKKNFDKNLVKANVAPEEIVRVLLNLFQNAFYSTLHKAKSSDQTYVPELTITTTLKDEEFQIRVYDNGEGISPEIKEKIFQPFFTTKPLNEGFGLGLSLCQDIITRDHKGKLTFESQSGKFAEFIITLPLSNTEPVQTSLNKVNIIS